MSPRRWIVAAVAGLAAFCLLVLGLPACNTPFIPLPPPADPTFMPVMVADGMGGTRTMWETRGPASGALAEAKVSVYNASVGAGVIVRAQVDGSYVAAPIDGREGDRIEIEYVARDGRAGPGICRLLQQGQARTECPK
ncbi:MAG TPA: hypothetical protein VN914_15685 [Polyangia bacterium]|nr:hypothetical protein [Polyangia bacterium]